MQKKNGKRRAGALMLVLLLLMSGCSRAVGGSLAENPGESQSGEKAVVTDGAGKKRLEGREGSGSVPVEGTMEVQFLDVGQGDATLIQCGEEAMLIDAGNNDRADDVAGYLKSRGIRELSYVIGTHPDADHIGGLDVVIEEFACRTVMMPELYHDTATYRDVLQAMEENGIPNTPPRVGEQYALGEAVFTILAPNRMDYGDNTNDYSIGLLLQHGEKRFLFTGDAEEAAEEDMLQNGISLQADVYKAAHHGSRSATTEEFLAAVSPSDAVISCGEGNRYGHPHAEVLNRLRMQGISVRRTDEEGTVVAVSDGNNITWNVSPADSWQTGEQQASDEERAETEGQTYILNTNTKKFHLPECSGAADIKAENKKETARPREELIGEGYEPCKRCHP